MGISDGSKQGWMSCLICRASENAVVDTLTSMVESQAPEGIAFPFLLLLY